MYKFPTDVLLYHENISMFFKAINSNTNFMMQMVKGKAKTNIRKTVGLFDANMSDATQNYFIIKGCSSPKHTGAGMKHDIKVSKFTVPSSARETGEITVSVWANFDKSTYTLTNKIFEKTTTMA